MPNQPNDLLLLAGKVLTILTQGVIAFAATACVIALPIVIFMQGEINAEVAKEFGDAVGAFPVLAVLGLIGFILILLALAFFFFGKLRAIIATVGEGDPFAPENAERLSAMGWITIASQAVMIPIAGLALVVAKWAEPMENATATVDGGFDLEGILLAIVLFILARVFKHGAAMREDLEGTV